MRVPLERNRLSRIAPIVKDSKRLNSKIGFFDIGVVQELASSIFCHQASIFKKQLGERLPRGSMENSLIKNHEALPFYSRAS
jgi:hypothetical protein